MAIDGTYKIVAKAPIGDQEGILVFKTEGNALTGSMMALGATLEFEEGKVEGNDFECKMIYKTPVGTTKSTVTGTVDGDNISGIFKAMMMKMNFSGTRVK